MAEKAVPQKNLMFVDQALKGGKDAVKSEGAKLKQTYGFDEAYKASLKYFNGDELAARVWVNKYALKDSDGNTLQISVNDPMVLLQ